MIKYFKGDVFSTTAQLIAHGCNCKGGFGSGVAGVIATKYPMVKNSYLKKFQDEGWNLGEVQVVGNKPGQWIANCATQKNYGSSRYGTIYVDYKAVEVVMKQLKEIIEENNWQLAMPKIGAGLAGGDWKIIEAIINKVFPETEVWVYEL